MTKDEYIVSLAEIGVELPDGDKSHYMALAQAIGYPDIIEKIRREILQYPAPLIPKREILMIIDDCMRVEN